MSTADIDAIKDYFVRTEAVTLEASKIKDEFTKWYDTLGWYSKSTDENFDLARNIRNRFNLANATTPEEKAAVETTMATGVSSEQAQGTPDRRLQNGMLPGPVTPPPAPLIPTEWKIIGGVGAFLALLLGISKR